MPKAAGFTIELSKAFYEFERYVNGLRRGGIERISRAAAYDCARKAAKMVKEGYATAAYARAPGTLAKYHFGGGGSRTWRGASPLKRSGTMMRSVVVRRDKGGKRGYTVQIHPTKLYTAADSKDSGKPVAQIANQMERPKPIVVRITPRMLRYLFWLGRKAGWNMASTGQGRRVGNYMVYNPTAKPVWALVKKNLTQLRGPLAKSIQRRLKIFRYNQGRAMGMKINL